MLDLADLQRNAGHGLLLNAGVISLTKVGSRQVIGVAGVLLILLGLSPKIMAVLSSIPGAVVSGVFLVICQILIVNGFRVVRKDGLDSRKAITVGMSVAAAVGVAGIAPEAREQFPLFVQYFLSSGIAVGALTAVILNLILPKSLDPVLGEVDGPQAGGTPLDEPSTEIPPTPSTRTAPVTDAPPPSDDLPSGPARTRGDDE